MMNSYEDLRITKLRDYLYNVVKEINNGIKEINADALNKDINSYSLDRIPSEPLIENWIIGTSIKRDVYDFKSRCAYSYNDIENLKNIGFFEKFEEIIRYNNENKIFPEIEGVEKIECLNVGTLLDVEKSTAEFDIQIQITFRENFKEQNIISI